MTLIPNWKTKKRQCYRCHTKEDVKYVMKKDFPFLDEPAHLCYCTRCVMMELAVPLKA